MKATSKPRRVAEMRAEYRLDYTKAKPNRFAARSKAQPVVIILEEDVAKVFKTSEDVNKALRALMTAMPNHS